MSKQEENKRPQTEIKKYKKIEFICYKHLFSKYMPDYKEYIYYEKYSCGIPLKNGTFWNTKIFYNQDDALNAAYILIDDIQQIG